MRQKRRTTQLKIHPEYESLIDVIRLIMIVRSKEMLMYATTEYAVSQCDWCEETKLAECLYSGDVWVMSRCLECANVRKDR